MPSSFCSSSSSSSSFYKLPATNTITMAEECVAVGGGGRSRKRKKRDVRRLSAAWESSRRNNGRAEADAADAGDININNDANSDNNDNDGGPSGSAATARIHGSKSMTMRIGRRREEADATRRGVTLTTPHHHHRRCYSTAASRQVSVGVMMPSAMASNAHGFRIVSRIMRSLLYDQLGLPLACYLHGPDAFRTARRRAPELFVSVPSSLQPQLPPFGGDDDLIDGYDGFLKDSVEEWIDAAKAVRGVPMERGLTALLSNKMRDALQHDGMTVAHDEMLVTTGGGGSGGGFGFGGVPDILVRAQESTDDHYLHHHPVLLVEAGLQNGQWWKKVDQALMYVACLVVATKRRPGPNDTNNNMAIPILVTVLTLEVGAVHQPAKDNKPQKTKKRRLTATRGTKKDSKLNSIGFLRGRIGTFLVTTSKDATKPSLGVDNLRVILLRRVETTELGVLSAEMGNVIRAARLLPTWARLSRRHTIGGMQQESCGLHCRRVGTKVFRLYDNRMMHTDRSPDSPGEGRVAVCVLKDGDSDDPLLEIGDRAHGSDNRYWMWKFQESCAVYASDYDKERHATQRPRDFIPVVDHLLELHTKGVVHGDVRCCNVAFGTHLVDNGRCRGRADRKGGGAVTMAMQDDWRALNSVLFEHHKFHPPPPPSLKRDQYARPSWWRRWWISAAAAVLHRRPAIRESTHASQVRALMMQKAVRAQMAELKSFAARDDPRPGLAEIEAHVVALKDFLAAAEAARWSVTPVSAKPCYV